MIGRLPEQAAAYLALERAGEGEEITILLVKFGQGEGRQHDLRGGGEKEKACFLERLQAFPL